MRSPILLAVMSLTVHVGLAAEPVGDGTLPSIFSGGAAKSLRPATGSTESPGTTKGAATNTAKPSNVAKPTKYTPPRFKVALPSGKELTQAAMELPKDWTKTFFPNDELVYVEKYPSDKVRGVSSFYQGKLNGPSAALYEEGGMSALANYAMSDRDGEVRLWEENKHRLLYAENKRGKKHGAACLFRDDLPWFVQEYEMGDLTAEYLVRWKEGASEVIPREKLASEDLRETAAARTRLTELEAAMDRNEARLKKSLREWFQEKDKEIKQKRVAKQSSARRDEHRKKLQAAQKNVQKSGQNDWRSALRATGL